LNLFFKNAAEENCRLEARTTIKAYLEGRHFSPVEWHVVLASKSRFVKNCLFAPVVGALTM